MARKAKGDPRRKARQDRASHRLALSLAKSDATIAQEILDKRDVGYNVARERGRLERRLKSTLEDYVARKGGPRG